MAVNSKIKEIYEVLKSGGADAGSSPEEFSAWFLAKGKEGYANRKYVYDTLTAGGADAGANYEEFAGWLGLHAVEKPVQKPQQQPQQQPVAKPVAQLVQQLQQHSAVKPGAQPVRQGTTAAEKSMPAAQTAAQQPAQRPAAAAPVRSATPAQRTAPVAPQSTQNANPQQTAQNPSSAAKTVAPQPQTTSTQPKAATSMNGLDYFRARRGGEDILISAAAVKAAGGLKGWETKHPGAPLRVYMSGTDKNGKPFNGHVSIDEAHNRSKENGYRYNMTNDTTYPKQVAAAQQRESIEKVLDGLWSEAEAKTKNDIEKVTKSEMDNYVMLGGGRENRMMASAGMAHGKQVAYLRNFDIEKMAQDAVNRLSSNNGAGDGASGPLTEEEKRRQEEFYQQVYNQVYNYAVAKNAPKSTIEFFMRKVMDANVLASIQTGLARSAAGTGDGLIKGSEQAMGEYEKKHGAVGVMGTVTGMTIDPVTAVSALAGGAFAKRAISLGGKIIAPKVAAPIASRLFTSTAAGRVTGAIAGSVGNFATYEGIKDAEMQFKHGGRINPETGETEGYSLGSVGKSMLHGAGMGAVMGIGGMLVGNVADKAVKATASTAGKIGVRAAEFGAGTLLNGTIFAADGYMQSGEFDLLHGIATDLGFKASHAIKTAPQRIASMRPIKNPRTMAERNHNRMSFEEHLRRMANSNEAENNAYLDNLRRNIQNNNGNVFSKEDREILNKYGYGELADVFAKSAKPKEARAAENRESPENLPEEYVERAEAEEIGLKSEFDGYDAMERLTQDSRVPETIRAKAYFIFTGKAVPVSTVIGYREERNDKDGYITVNSVNANGGVVTSRRFKNEKQAEAERNNIMRQAELNSIDMGERFKEAEADEKELQFAIGSVAPGADYATVRQIYKDVTSGEEGVTDSERALADAIALALEQRRGEADAYRPSAIRERLNKELNGDVEAALKKMPKDRTEEEQALVERYAEELYPKKTPEQEEAESMYEYGKQLYGRVYEGDIEAQVDIEAINLRVDEARRMCEEAFGDDAEYWMERVDENPWEIVDEPTLSESQRDAVLYYINSKAAQEGVQTAQADAIEARRAEVESSVRKRTHQERGTIQPATMKVNDRRVYVVKGEVAMFPDGTAVDHNSSSESVIVCDAETGEYKFVSPDDILRVEDEIDPPTELDAAFAAIDAEQSELFAPANADNLSEEAYDAMWMRGDDKPTEGVPNIGDNPQNGANAVSNITENAVSGAESGPNSDNSVENVQKGSALSRIPVDEKTQEPMYEQAPDAETAWDGLVEAVGGGTKDAAEIAQAQADAIAAELRKLTSKPPKLSGSPTQMIAQKKEHQEKIDALQGRLDIWNGILGVNSTRVAAERERLNEQRRAEQARLHDEAQARFEEQQRIKAEKEAEQAGVGTHAVNPKIKEKWDNATKVEGAEDALTLADGSTIRGRYVMAEAGAATASHDVNNAFAPSEGFPIDKNGQSVNDRDYERDMDAQRIVESIADSYDNRALQTPVIVSRDGIVLSGNNRTMSGDMAARRGTDKAYVDYLREFAGKYGFTPEQVEGMKHPRVAFVPNESLPYDASTFARFNAQEMKSQSKPEAAVKLGKTVPDDVFKGIVNEISGYDRLSEYYANENAVAQALGALQRAGVINEKQMPEMRTGTAVSAAGRELIENTLIGKVFQASPDAVRQIIGNGTLKEAIVMGLTEIASNRTLANGYDLSDELAKAVDLVARAKAALPDVYKEGVAVSPFGRQAGLFDDEFGDSRVTDGVVLMLADALNSGKPSELRKMLAVYNGDALSAASGQMDIFSGAVPSKEEVMNLTKESFRNATPKEQQAIVDGAIADRKRRAELESEQRAGTETTGEAVVPAEGAAGAETTGIAGDARGMGERSGDLLSEEAVTCELSNEVNEFGKPFVMSSNGTIDFGFIDEESGLQPLPIRLSLGENYKDERNDDHGYGYIHISAGHRAEILQNGFSSVEEFVESVARDYTDIRIGAKIGNNQTYLLEVTDEHNNTLFIQLSRDGKYWNVNSAGIFKKKYSRRKPKVYSKPAVGDGIASDTIEVNSGQNEGATAPAGNSSKTSDDKVNASASETQKQNVVSVEDSQSATKTTLTDSLGINSSETSEHKVNTSASFEQANSSKSSVNEGVERVANEPTEAQKMVKAIEENPYSNAYFDEESGRTLYDTTQAKNKEEFMMGLRTEYPVSDIPNEYKGKLINLAQRVFGSGTTERTEKRGVCSEVSVSQKTQRRDKEFLKELYNAITGDTDEAGHNSIYYTGKILPSVYCESVLDEEAGCLYEITYRRAKYVGRPDMIWVTKYSYIGDGAGVDKLAGAVFSITPTTYTNKKGKTSDVHLVKFSRELTRAERSALDSFVREPIAEGRKTSRGWYDRNEGGYMMRSEDAARQLGEMIADKTGEAVADAQPLSKEEIREAVAPMAEAKKQKAQKKPANRASIDEVMSEPEEQPKAEQKPTNKGPKLVMDENTKASEDILRSLLGIDDNDFDDNVFLRDGDIKLTPAQRNQVYAAGVNYALWYIDNGFVKFEDFATAMSKRLGSKIKPWLKSFYNGARDIPGYEDVEFTPYEEVSRFDVDAIGKPTAEAIDKARQVLAEQEAKKVAAQAEKELKEERNKKRKERDEQTTANTVALAAEAGAVAGEASRAAETSSDSKELRRADEKVDNVIGKIDEQLAMLDYYEGPDAEAEKRMTDSAVRLARSLAHDLGIEVTDGQKKADAVRVSIVPEYGGNVKISLPVGVYDPIVILFDFKREGDGFKIRDITYRHVESNSNISYIIGENNQVVVGNQTYGQILADVKRIWGKELKNTATTPLPMDTREMIKQWLDEDEKGVRWRSPWAGDQAHKLLGVPKDEAFAIIKSLREERDAQRAADMQALADMAERGESPYTVTPEVEAELAKRRAEMSVNGYKIGDEVMYDRNGKGKWEKYKITDFDGSGRPILDSFGVSFISEVGDWNRIKPANGVFGEAERVARMKNSGKPAAPSTEPDLSPIVETLRSGRPVKRSKNPVKAEDKIGDVFKEEKKPEAFGGLFGGLEEVEEAPTVKAPEKRATEELAGDSAQYQEKETQTASLVNEISHEIAKRVEGLIADPNNAKALTMTDVKRIAAKYPEHSKTSDTDLQELVELAMTQLTRREAMKGITGTAEAQREAYDKIVNLYRMQPSLNARDSERLMKQQYSTPTPFGYVMGQFVRAGGKDVNSMLEPSAGNGALTIAIDPRFIHVNDIDEARLANLRKLGFGKVTAQDALLPFTGEERMDVVMTNPPFGTVAERLYDDIFRISSLEGQMAINALERMKDDGRAAIVIGGNTSYRDNGSMNPKDAAFFGYLYSRYNVVDVINISGKALYSRNGTGYDVRMILIDGRKTGEFNRTFPPVKAKARAEQVTTFDELYKRVQDDIQQIQQVGNRSADVQREPGTGIDGKPGAPVRNGNGEPNSRHGRAPGESGSMVGGSSGMARSGSVRGDVGGKTDRVDNVHGGDGTGSYDVQRSNRRESGRGELDKRVDNGRGGSVGDGRVATSSRLDTGRERLAVKPDLNAEKVEYPAQSNNGFTLLSVVPAAQAEVLKKSLGEIGDVDRFLVNELGYSSEDELYGYLAAEQIDSVALAIHQMNKGNAFIIGDMTGVGKGRQGAALIRYAVKKGKTPIYFTQKPTLFTDNYRDLSDIGSGELRPFIMASVDKERSGDIVDADGNLKYKIPTQREKDRVYKYVLEHGTLPKEYDYVLSTYSQIQNGWADYESTENGWVQTAKKYGKGKKETAQDRSGQMRRDVLARLAEGNIAILDESHTVGGDSGCGRYMQMLTSSAEGVTFLSATFAKRADNMPIYAQRTAISEGGISAPDMIAAIAKGGVTLQEIMSKQLVESGQMIRRERSFEGVTIDWLPVDEGTNVKQREQFDEVAEIFNGIRDFQNDFVKPIVNRMNEDAAEMGATVGLTKGTESLGVKNTPFASKMYNLVNQLLFALKVDAVADRVVENLRNGCKPVISFTNTMEGFLKEASKDVEMDEVPNFSVTLMRALDGVLRFTAKDADEKATGSQIGLSELSAEGLKAYNDLREKIMNLSADLPISPMDAIRMKIEDAGYSVAEITGREVQLNRTKNGKYVVEARKDRDKKAAMRDFNSGKLDVLMINKSGSIGISLHASSKFKDQRQRVMVFAQFQSDINDEVQMRGRIDRSGQVMRGRYEYIMSTIPAEQRIQMMFKAKLKSLDANTTSSQKSKFNEMEIVDYLNKYGDEVVWEYMKDHPELEERFGDPLNMLKEDSEDATPRLSEKENTEKKPGCAATISRYLAFLSVDEQDRIFNEITDNYRVKIQLLDDAGENDLEITTMPLRAESMRRQIWHRGAAPASGNAFADNTYVEEVEVDVLKKPMTRKEIDAYIRKLMGANATTATEYDQARYGSKEDEINWTRFARNKVDEVKQFYRVKVDDAISKMQKAAEAKIAKEHEKAVKKAMKERSIGNNNFSDAEIQSLANAVADEVRMKEVAKQNKRRDEILKSQNHIVALFQRLSAGSIYVVPTDIKNATPEMFSQTFGTFVGFKFNKDFTLGSSTAIFATLDGRRKVELALNQQGLLTIIKSTEIARRYSPKEIGAIKMDNWDSHVPTQTREKRYIITGNLLQALVDTDKGEKTKGNLISYSTIDGETRQGILMGENFKLADLRNSAKLSSRLPQIMEGKAVVSENGDVTIERVAYGWPSGSFELRVPKSKQRGGIYSMNKELLKFIDGNNFRTKGNHMVGNVPKENIARVLDMLSREPFNLTVLEESQLTEADKPEATGDMTMQRTLTGEDIEKLNGRYADLENESMFGSDPRNVLEDRMRAHELDKMADAAVGMSERLGGGDSITIYRTREDARAAGLPEYEVRSLGGYRIGSNEMFFVLENNRDAQDVVDTFMHEDGHAGIRLLFPTKELYDNAMDEMYSASNDKIRSEIDAETDMYVQREAERLMRDEDFDKVYQQAVEEHGYAPKEAYAHAEAGNKKAEYRRRATDEYGARVAQKVGENGFEKMTRDEQTFWGKLKALLDKALDNLLRGLKIPKMRKWGDKEWARVYHEAWKRRRQGGKRSMVDIAEHAVERAQNSEDGVMFMGSKTERKMAEIEAYFKGKMLDENQRAVVDVFAGKRNNVAVEVERPEGNTLVVMRQGNEDRAGAKHSLFRHFGTRSNFITYEDIGMIPEIIEKGEREVNGLRVTYTYRAKDNARVKVTTKFVGGREVFTNLISNRKAPDSESYHNTHLSAQATESEASNAKLENNSEYSKSINDDDVMLRSGDDVMAQHPVLARALYEQRVATSSYQVREAMQDSMLGLLEAYKAIEKASGRNRNIEDIAGPENAYLWENRLSSKNKAEQDAYRRLVIKPMLKEVAKLAPNDRERERLTRYMMAKHGLERNIVMRDKAIAAGMKQTKAAEKDFAGLTGLAAEALGMSVDTATAEAWAEQEVLDYERMHETDALWGAVNGATKVTLSILKEGGLLSQDTHNNIASMYENYIPLRGWAETTADEVYGYLGRNDGSVRGSVLKKAYGRTSIADDPIATIAMMGEQAIAQANRNKMKQAFFNYVRRNPSDLVSVNRLWLKYDDASNEWLPAIPEGQREILEGDDAATVARKWSEHEKNMEGLVKAEPDKYKRGRQARGIPFKMGTGVLSEHTVLVRCDDDTYVMTINDSPRAAQALNGMTNPHVGDGFGARIYRAAESVTRFASGLYTQFSPEFMLSDFLRDAGFTNTISWAKENPEYASRFFANFNRVNPLRMGLLFNLHERGKLDMSDELHKHFSDFILNGGETGYTRVYSLKEHKLRVEREIRRAGKKISCGKMLGFIGEQYEIMNRSAEGCARFAAYLASREMGRSIDRSIWDAKEISVNFNKKGAGSRFAGAPGETWQGTALGYVTDLGKLLFPFWNATIQAVNGFAKVGARHPMKFTPLMALLLGLGAWQAMTGAWGDDEESDKEGDDRNAYDNQPDYVRRSNVLYRCGDVYLSWPLPHEYLAVYGMGELMGSLMSGRREMSAYDVALESMSMIGEFLPVKLEGGGVKHSFIPMQIKPAIEATINESWTGMPIYNDYPMKIYLQ